MMAVHISSEVLTHISRGSHAVLGTSLCLWALLTAAYFDKPRKIFRQLSCAFLLAGGITSASFIVFSAGPRSIHSAAAFLKSYPDLGIMAGISVFFICAGLSSFLEQRLQARGQEKRAFFWRQMQPALFLLAALAYMAYLRPVESLHSQTGPLSGALMMALGSVLMLLTAIKAKFRIILAIAFFLAASFGLFCHSGRGYSSRQHHSQTFQLQFPPDYAK